MLIPALVQRHDVPGIVAALKCLDLACREPFVVDIGAAAQPIEIAFGWLTGDLNVIDLRNDARLRHEIREFTIVRENEQSG